jgi:hypothetical protein
VCDVAGWLNYRPSESGCLVSEMIGVLHEREARVKVGNLVLVVFATGFNLLMAETGLRLFYVGVREDLQVSAYRAYSVEEQDVRERSLLLTEWGTVPASYTRPLVVASMLFLEYDQNRSGVRANFHGPGAALHGAPDLPTHNPVDQRRFAF